MKEEKIDGLDLKDFKDIERTAGEELIVGKKIVMASTMMLENAEKMIKHLGGETVKELNKRLEKERKEQSENTTKV